MNRTDSYTHWHALVCHSHAETTYAMTIFAGRFCALASVNQRVFVQRDTHGTTQQGFPAATWTNPTTDKVLLILTK
jgi:hypothetical protein